MAIYTDGHLTRASLCSSWAGKRFVICVSSCYEKNMTASLETYDVIVADIKLAGFP